MKLKNIAETLFDEQITLINTLWFAGLSAQLGSQGSKTFDDVFEYDLDDETAKRLLGLTYAEFKERFVGDYDELASYFAREGRLGFLVQASTPVPKYEEEVGYSAGWGHTTSQWFYTLELTDDDFIKELVKWRNDVHTRQKRKKVST